MYTFDNNTQMTRKIYSNGNVPVMLDETMIAAYYRYDSGAREFKLIPDNKTLSIVVDAVALHSFTRKH